MPPQRCAAAWQPAWPFPRKSVAQVVLRRLTQRGVVAIPKSVRAERMAENIDIFDFELTDEQMAAIATLDTGASQFFDHHDPEVVSWLAERRVDARPTRGAQRGRRRSRKEARVGTAGRCAPATADRLTPRHHREPARSAGATRFPSSPPQGPAAPRSGPAGRTSPGVPCGRTWRW